MPLECCGERNPRVVGEGGSVAPSGLGLFFGGMSQGVALGYRLSARWAATPGVRRYGLEARSAGPLRMKWGMGRAHFEANLYVRGLGATMAGCRTV